MFTWTSPTNSDIHFPLIVRPTFSLEKSGDLEDEWSLSIARRDITTRLKDLARIQQETCDHRSKELYKDLIRQDPENHERINWVVEAIDLAAESLRSSHQRAARHAVSSGDLYLLDVWRTLYETFEDFSARLFTDILSAEDRYFKKRDRRIRQLDAQSKTSLPARLSAEVVVCRSTEYFGTLHKAIDSAGTTIEGLCELDERTTGFRSNRLTDPVFLIAADGAERFDRANGTQTAGVRYATQLFYPNHSALLKSLGYEDPEALCRHIMRNQRKVLELGEEFEAGSLLTEEDYLKRLTALGGNQEDHPTISDSPESMCSNKMLRNVTLDRPSVGADTRASHIALVDDAWENMRR